MADLVTTAFGAQVTAVGSTQYSAAQVAATLPVASDLKEKDSTRTMGVIEGRGFFKAPKGSVLRGDINFVETIGAESELTLIIDTRLNTDVVKDFMLFDAHGLNKNDCNTGNCPGITEVVDNTKVYFGEEGNVCKYEALIAQLCSKAFILGSMTYRPERVAGGTPQIHFPIVVVNSNLQDGKTQYSFNPGKHQTANQVRDIFNLPLQGDAGMLYNATGWILKSLQPGHLFYLDLTVLAKGFIN
jgi:hypothetical protein